jgi:hypothetical protein
MFCTIPCSPAASVVASVSSTNSRTLVEDTSRDCGSSSRPPISHERHAGLPIIANDDADEWSDDNTIIISQYDHSQAESAELPIIVAPASSPREAIGAESKTPINEKVGRYAMQEKVEGFPRDEQPRGRDSHSFEYHLSNFDSATWQKTQVKRPGLCLTYE